MSVADLSYNQRKELAHWLNGFPPATEDNEEPDEYWHCLADHLRKTKSSLFEHYTNSYLVTIGAKENPGLYLLNDLTERNLDLMELMKCLEAIGCQKGLNVFRTATPPVISLQPTQKHVVINGGEKIILTIAASCQPGKPKFQWFKHREPVVGQITPTLTIKNANKLHTGYYCCRVMNPFINDSKKGSVFSEFVNVEVVGGSDGGDAGIGKSYHTQETGGVPDDVLPPKITLHPSPVTVRLREKLTLECTAEGGELYDWYKDGKVYKLSCKQGLLVIESAQSSDCGVYYCVAVNRGDKVESQRAKITVESGIIIEEQPKDVSIRLTGDVELSCSASNVYGAPMKYTWYQEGKADSVGEGQVYKTKLSRTRYTEIKFYCLVSLAKSPEICARSKSAQVTVNTLWITQQLHSLKGTIGERRVLTCKAEGRGKISYLWLMSPTKGGQKEKLERNNDGVLAFSKLAQKHWGYYVCQAENEYQFIDSNEVLLSIHLPDALDRRRKRALQPPLIRILKHPWSQVILKESKFRVLCEAVCTKDEPLHYQWYRNRKPILGATESSYMRRHAKDSDYGSYYCVVRSNSNKASDVTKTARIERASSTTQDSPNIVGKSGTQVRQGRAEQEQKTMADERFARMKVALLIGNQNYRNISPLISPENDIRELSTMLENDLDFKVISLVNLTHTEMMQALEKFYELLSVAGIYALFYYSGHGFAGQNKDYLVPVDAEIPLRSSHNINVEGIIKKMQNKFSRAIVVLDCCRVAEDMIFSRPDSSLQSLEEAPANMSNYVLISSCMRNNPAYDTSEPNSASSDLHQRGGGPPAAASVSPTSSSASNGTSSFFNMAFRDALTQRRSIYKIYQHIIQMFIKDSPDDQRPEIRGSFADGEITFHDEVMMDDEKNEDKLNKIMETYDQAHTVPEPVTLGEEDMGILAGLVRVELCFSYDFSNVLCIETNVYLCTDKATTAKVTFDRNFIESQGVTCDQSPCEPSHHQSAEEEDEGAGGEGEGEMMFVTNLTISSVQRLGKKNLKLVFTVTLQVEGQDKSVTMSYQFPKKPLFASILHV